MTVPDIAQADQVKKRCWTERRTALLGEQKGEMRLAEQSIIYIF